ncbi:MAG: hypothetical protein AAFU56_11795 [Pseudomonadota bacterium]
MAIMSPMIMGTVWKLTFEPHAPLDMERHKTACLDMIFNGLKQRD